MNPEQVEQKIDLMVETLKLMDIKEPIIIEKVKPKRERKEYMRKYYADHKDDLLNRSRKRYTPKKKKNIEIEKIENPENI